MVFVESSVFCLLVRIAQNAGFKRLVICHNTLQDDTVSAIFITGLSEIFIGDRYSACKPGPKLIVHYTGLVQPPSKVWCEKVTGHSAMIVWSKGNKCYSDERNKLIETTNLISIQLNDDFG